MARDAKSLLKTYQEYQRRIDEALDEIERISPDSVILERYRNEFQPITTDEPNYNALQKVTAKARKLLESGRLSIEQLERNKAETINTLRGQGYDIDSHNFNAFFRFIDDARSRGLAAIYGSDDLIDAVYQMRKAKLRPWQIKENIARWADETVKYDRKGKIKPVENPKAFEMKNVRVKKEHNPKPVRGRKPKS